MWSMDTLRVEVAYALSERQEVVTVLVPSGATLREAVEASGVLSRHPEIDLSKRNCGIFGRIVALDTPLEGGDRVEIYRELIADPKEARRRRALGKG